MVPHAIITVSLATAILPRLSAKAANGDLAGLAGTLAGTLRTALAMVVPFALALPLLAFDRAKVLFGYGATSETFDNYVMSMILFGPGLVLFTVHYLMLRGFTPSSSTARSSSSSAASPRPTSWSRSPSSSARPPRARHRRSCSPTPRRTLVGSAVSYGMLARRLGGLETPTSLRFLVRLLIAGGISTAMAWLLGHALPGTGDDISHLIAATRLVTLGGVDVVVFVGLARLMRLREVTTVLDLVVRRLPGATLLPWVSAAKGRGCPSTPGPATCSPGATD